MRNETIVFDHVTKSFGNFSLNDLTFSVKKGYITGFIGPNGAGKTSTIKLIMNLINKDSGQVKIFDLDHTKHEKEIKQRIGFVYSENYFYDEWTIDQAKWVISSFYKNWDEALFAKYVESFQLPRKKKIKHLSTGTRMKFFLALALSHHADLLVLDEPTSGLDPAFRSELLDILAELVRGGEKTVFFSTHITTDLDRLGDYITFINKGKIVFSEAKDDILDQYRLVKGPLKMLNVDSREVLIGVRETSTGFEALTREPRRARELFQSSAMIEVPTLEDIMVYTVRGSECV